MNRRSFLSVVSVSLLAAPLVAEAQQAGRVYRIGMLWTTVPDRARQATFDAFKQDCESKTMGRDQPLLLSTGMREGITNCGLPEVAPSMSTNPARPRTVGHAAKHQGQRGGCAGTVRQSDRSV